jgi:hypothetical protein
MFVKKIIKNHPTQPVWLIGAYNIIYKKKRLLKMYSRNSAKLKNHVSIWIGTQ